MKHNAVTAPCAPRFGTPKIGEGYCIEHDRDLICAHACTDGACTKGCEDRSDREIRRDAAKECR